MKRKIRLREKTAFVLFLVSMSAMDSDSRVVAVIIIITTLGILFYAGQAYRGAKGKWGKRWDIKCVHTAAQTWTRARGVTAGMRLRRRNRKTSEAGRA